MEGLAEIPDKSVDLVVTDPPYGLSLGSASTLKGKLSAWADICNAAYWYAGWMRECRRVLKNDGALWTFTNWRYFAAVQKAGMDIGWGIESLLIWDKGWIGPGGKRGLRPTYEQIALLAMPDFAIKNRSVPDIKQVKWAAYKPTGHPAEKPIELINWIIKVSDKQGGIILDPFIGSGTTACAATKETCMYIGFEMDKQWSDKAEARIAEVRR